MRYSRTILLSAALLAALSCNKNNDVVPSGDESISQISFQARPFIYAEDTSTKSALGPSNNFIWEATDTVGVFPLEGSQIWMSMEAGAGTDNAIFDGGGWALKSSTDYYSYFPFIGDMYLDKTRIPVSYLGQIQSGSGNTSHLGAYDYMYTEGTCASNGAVDFMYKHLGCILRVSGSLPAGTFTKMTLEIQNPSFITTGYVNLTSSYPSVMKKTASDRLSIDLNGFEYPTGGVANIYIMCPPVDLNGQKVKITFTDTSKIDYLCTKIPSRVYEPGYIYGLNCMSFTKVDQSIGVGQEDWEIGEDEGGECE